MEMCVYLAGKMTGLSPREMNGWRESAADNLSNCGFSVLNPAEQALNSQKVYTAREVVDSNKFQIQNCSVVLAELDHDDVSIGTIGELVYARSIGKPIIGWGTAKITGHPWVVEHTTKIFVTCEDAVNYLINNYTTY
jgi:nucleoside 2-deoxyribosyltransferase